MVSLEEEKRQLHCLFLSLARLFYDENEDEQKYPPPQQQEYCKIEDKFFWAFTWTTSSVVVGNHQGG